MTVSLILNNRPVPRAQLETLPNLPPNFAVVYPWTAAAGRSSRPGTER
ncbi:hypothetical protein BN2537_9389 [Streptomyces venezuelae]|nr:hypothetical protein BN2537_9389 [Streptomyces venezuelae]